MTLYVASIVLAGAITFLYPLATKVVYSLCTGGSIMSRPAGSIEVCNQTLIFSLLINILGNVLEACIYEGILVVANMGGSRGMF